MEYYKHCFEVVIPGAFDGYVYADSRRVITLAASKNWPGWRRRFGSFVRRVRLDEGNWRGDDRKGRRLQRQRLRYPEDE